MAKRKRNVKAAVKPTLEQTAQQAKHVTARLARRLHVLVFANPHGYASADILAAMGNTAKAVSALLSYTDATLGEAGSGQ